jgi:hypothetical protein
MTDTTQAPGKDQRSAIAKRLWINDAREEVAEEAATGIAYEFLGRTKEGVTVPGDGQAYYLKFDDLTPAALRMLAGFGGLTLMGNVTNTWLGTKPGERTPKACEAIAARIQGLNDGQWADRSRTGFQLNLDSLAAAIVAVGVETGKIPTEKAAEQVDAFRAKVEAEPDWAKSVYKVPAIAAAYAREQGRELMSVDDVFSVTA